MFHVEGKTADVNPTPILLCSLVLITRSDGLDAGGDGNRTMVVIDFVDGVIGEVV